MTPHPKPQARVVDKKAGVAKVNAELWCRPCAVLGRRTRATNRMHIVGKGQGGDDVDANIVPGCGSGTTGCHGVLTSRNADGSTGDGYATVAYAFVEGLTDEERRYAESTKWPGWLEDHYLTGSDFQTPAERLAAGPTPEVQT